jgi:hypothetical protein
MQKKYGIWRIPISGNLHMMNEMAINQSWLWMSSSGYPIS